MKTFLTWQEDEAYRQGRKDASYGKRDMTRPSRMASDYDSPDRAYWKGQDDYLREKAIQESYREYWDEQYEKWRNGE